jgi:hypothetical protein
MVRLLFCLSGVLIKVLLSQIGFFSGRKIILIKCTFLWVRKQMKVEMVEEKDKKNPTASPSDGENAMDIQKNGCKKVTPNKKRERSLTEDQNKTIKRKKTDGYQVNY